MDISHIVLIGKGICADGSYLIGIAVIRECRRNRQFDIRTVIADDMYIGTVLLQLIDQSILHDGCNHMTGSIPCRVCCLVGCQLIIGNEDPGRRAAGELVTHSTVCPCRRCLAGECYADNIGLAKEDAVLDRGDIISLGRTSHHGRNDNICSGSVVGCNLQGTVFLYDKGKSVFDELCVRIDAVAPFGICTTVSIV